MGCIGFAVDWGINLLNDAKYQSTANVLRSHGKLLQHGFPTTTIVMMMTMMMVINHTRNTPYQ